MSLRLSKREMADWTGSPQKRRQIGFLRLNRIPFDTDLDGWPVVRRCVFDRSNGSVQDDAPAWKPHKAA